MSNFQMRSFLLFFFLLFTSAFSVPPVIVNEAVTGVSSCGAFTKTLGVDGARALNGEAVSTTPKVLESWNQGFPHPFKVCIWVPAGVIKDCGPGEKSYMTLFVGPVAETKFNPFEAAPSTYYSEKIEFTFGTASKILTSAELAADPSTVALQDAPYKCEFVFLQSIAEKFAGKDLGNLHMIVGGGVLAEMGSKKINYKVTADAAVHYAENSMTISLDRTHPYHVFINPGSIPLNVPRISHMGQHRFVREQGKFPIFYDPLVHLDLKPTFWVTGLGCGQCEGVANCRKTEYKCPKTANVVLSPIKRINEEAAGSSVCIENEVPPSFAAGPHGQKISTRPVLLEWNHETVFDLLVCVGTDAFHPMPTPPPPPSPSTTPAPTSDRRLQEQTAGPSAVSCGDSLMELYIGTRPTFSLDSYAADSDYLGKKTFVVTDTTHPNNGKVCNVFTVPDILQHFSEKPLDGAKAIAASTLNAKHSVGAAVLPYKVSLLAIAYKADSSLTIKVDGNHPFHVVLSRARKVTMDDSDGITVHPSNRLVVSEPNAPVLDSATELEIDTTYLFVIPVECGLNCPKTLQLTDPRKPTEKPDEVQPRRRPGARQPDATDGTTKTATKKTTSGSVSMTFSSALALLVAARFIFV